MEHGGKLFDELTEVDALIGGEIEDDLGAVEGVFHIDKLHIQPAVSDLFLADGIGIARGLKIFFVDGRILFVGDAKDRLQWFRNVAVRQPMGGQADAGVFDAARSFDDDVVVGIDLLTAAVKIIYFSGVLKLHAYDLWHGGSPLYRRLWRAISMSKAPRMKAGSVLASSRSRAVVVSCSAASAGARSVPSASA